MVLRNIIIFGDPAVDRRFVLERAGVSFDPNAPLPRIFETQRHFVTIANQEYALYYTAGLPGVGISLLKAREVLGNLFCLIRALDGGINLLIYIVHKEEPSAITYSLFHEHLCQRDAPIILVQTTDSPTNPILSWFKLALTLDGTDPESDKVNLHNAIAKCLKKIPKTILATDRFEQTARGAWKLLEKITGWSLADCRDALKFTFKNYGYFSEKDAEAKCESIVESIKK